MVRKNGSEVEIFFPENSIAFLRVNWYLPHFQGQKNEIFSTRGSMSVNMSLGIQITSVNMSLGIQITCGEGSSESPTRCSQTTL